MSKPHTRAQQRQAAGTQSICRKGLFDSFALDSPTLPVQVQMPSWASLQSCCDPVSGCREESRVPGFLSELLHACA